MVISQTLVWPIYALEYPFCRPHRDALRGPKQLCTACSHLAVLSDSAERIVQVSRDASNALAGTDGGTRFRRWEWGRQIKEGQAAHAWSRFLPPLYGMQVIGLLASMTYAVRPFSKAFESKKLFDIFQFSKVVRGVPLGSRASISLCMALLSGYSRRRENAQVGTLTSISCQAPLRPSADSTICTL